MKLIHKILSLFKKQPALVAPEVDKQPEATPPPAPAPQPPVYFDDDEYFTTRAECELIIQKDKLEGMHMGAQTFGNGKIPLPILLPRWLSENEAKTLKHSYKGVLLSNNGLSFIDQPGANGVVDIKSFFCKEDGGRIVSNGVNAAALEYTLHHHNGPVRYLITIQQRSASDSDLFMSFMTTTVNIESPNDVMLLHHSFDSCPDEKKADESRCKMARTRLEAYQKAFNHTPLSSREEVAIGAVPLMQTFNKNYTDILTSGFNSVSFKNCEQAFHNLFPTLALKTSTPDDYRNALNMSAKLLSVLSQKGNYARASYYAHVCKWLINKCGTALLSPEQQNCISQFSTYSKALSAWTKFKPTRMGVMLYHFHGLVPSDIKGMIVTSKDNSAIEVKADDVWNFDFINAAKEFGDFSAFINVTNSTIIPMHVALDGSEVDVEMADTVLFDENFPYPYLHYKFPANTYLTKEEFVAKRSKIANDIVEGNAPSDYDKLLLGRNEQAHLEFDRGRIAHQNSWEAEALYRMCRAAMALGNPIYADKHDSYDSTLIDELPFHIVYHLMEKNFYVGSIGYISGSPHFMAISALFSAYTAVHDPRLGNLANAVLAQQEKFLLSSNNAVIQAPLAPEKLNEQKRQIDAIRPHFPDSCFLESSIKEYDDTLYFTAQVSKYYSFIFTQEYSKAKALLNSMRITENREDLSFIENQTAKNRSL